MEPARLLSALPLRRVAIVTASAALLTACAGTPPATSTPAPTFSPSPALTASPTAPATAQSSPTPTATSVPTPTGIATPTASPSSSPSAKPSGSIIATFQVADEQYRVLIVDPDEIAIARKLLAGKQAPQIPNGRIARGDGGVNQPWSWHIDPRDFEFADMTIELCDGLPSYVEDGTLTGDRFCPWSAKVVAVDPAP
jgi:hypothetical protein